jgi:hypothetical protein
MFRPALGWIVTSLLNRGQDLTGIEAGFFSEMSEHLLVSDLGAAPPFLRAV